MHELISLLEKHRLYVGVSTWRTASGTMDIGGESPAGTPSSPGASQFAMCERPPSAKMLATSSGSSRLCHRNRTGIAHQIGRTEGLRGNWTGTRKSSWLGRAISWASKLLLNLTSLDLELAHSPFGILFDILGLTPALERLRVSEQGW